MKSLPIFFSLIILLVSFGLIVSYSEANAAAGDVEQSVSINANYVRHLVRIGDYIYVTNLFGGVWRVTKINKSTGSVVANYNTCGGLVGFGGDIYDMETDGTYLWVNEKSTVYSGACSPFNTPPGYSSYGLTKIDPNSGQILQRIWFTQVSKASAYDGSGYIWAGVSSKLCKIPVNDPSVNKADTCYAYGFGYIGHITKSDGTYIYAHTSGTLANPGDFLLKIRQSDGSLTGSVRITEYNDDVGGDRESVFLKGNEVWVMDRPVTFGDQNQYVYKVETAGMTPSSAYSSHLYLTTGEGWGQSNIASEGSCLWVGGKGETGSLEETLSILDSSGNFIKKINVDPGTGNNELYDTLYDAAAQKMWVSSPAQRKVYRLDASGCPVANNPPNIPSSPSPAHLAANVSRNADLSWIGGDPDGDPVTYDVYFEANDPTPDVLVSANQSATTYDPGTMSYGTTYYWQIIAHDDKGATATGSVWRFTTQHQPTVDGVTIGADPILADGSTTYIITITSSDDDGVANLNDLRILINYQGSNAGSYRGYFRWDDSVLDASWTDTGSCSGGGYYGKYASGYGYQYVDLVSCNTSTSGNQRTVNFVFHANTDWGSDGPLTNNDISGWAMDDNTNSVGWFNFDLNFGVTPSTGTISGYVWDDGADADCVFDAGETPFAGVRVYLSGDTVETNTLADGSYTLTSVPAGTHTVCVDNTGWSSTCDGYTGLCQAGVVVTAGAETSNINFGLKQIAAWYRGGISGDVHSDGRIYSIPVPSGEYFVTGSGVVSADNGISISPGGVAESTWVIDDYDEIGWPTSLVNSVTATDTTKTVKVYKFNDLTIDSGTTWAFDSNPKIVVANDISIAGDVTTQQINAVLIAKGDFTVQPVVPTGNDTLTIKGAVYANQMIVNRELINNSEPVMKVEFDPQYFVYTDTPYFTQASHTWEEVR